MRQRIDIVRLLTDVPASQSMSTCDMGCVEDAVTLTANTGLPLDPLGNRNKAAFIQKRSNGRLLEQTRCPAGQSQVCGGLPSV